LNIFGTDTKYNDMDTIGRRNQYKFDESIEKINLLQTNILIYICAGTSTTDPFKIN